MKWFFFVIIVGTPFVLVALVDQGLVPKISQGITSWQDSRVIDQQSIYIPENATSRTRTVYVREFSNFRPPNGAPVFYVPYPDTLCMLGKGNEKAVRVIYERTPGACDALIEGMNHG